MPAAQIALAKGPRCAGGRYAGYKWEGWRAKGREERCISHGSLYRAGGALATP